MKYMNVWKRYIKAIAILLVVLMLTGCGTSSTATDKNTDSERFVKVSDNGKFDIYVDTETDVMYAVSDCGYSLGVVTLLVDRDGKPLLWEGE